MHRPIALIILAAIFDAPAAAGELVVRIENVANAAGEVGCALYRSDAGFPMDSTVAEQQWQRAVSSGVVCRFTGLPAGRYAIAVSHDLDGDRRTDTNLVGIPTEAWGVSNNVRPMFRAPRFEEAAVAVPGDATATISVRLDL